MYAIVVQLCLSFLCSVMLFTVYWYPLVCFLQYLLFSFIAILVSALASASLEALQRDVHVTCVHMRICLYVYMYVYTCIDRSIDMPCICVYIYIYIYIYICARSEVRIAFCDFLAPPNRVSRRVWSGSNMACQPAPLRVRISAAARIGIGVVASAALPASVKLKRFSGEEDTWEDTL